MRASLCLFVPRDGESCESLGEHGGSGIAKLLHQFSLPWCVCPEIPALSIEHRLSTPPGQRALFRVLKAYAVADPSIGYTQGMNFVAGLILSYVPSEAGAFGVFWLIMHGRGLRDCYKPDMSMLQVWGGRVEAQVLAWMGQPAQLSPACCPGTQDFTEMHHQLSKEAGRWPPV